MNIGFDLDKVLINYPPLIPGRLIDRIYKKKSNGELLYRIPSRPEQLIRNAIHHPWLRLPIKDNIQFLSNIPKETHTLYLISSRFGFLRKRTEALVKKYHLHKIFDGMYFNYENKQPHIFKDEIIRNLNLDIYIDDDRHLINYVAKKNKKTKFYWFNPKHASQQLTKNIYSIKHLSEIFS